MPSGLRSLATWRAYRVTVRMQGTWGGPTRMAWVPWPAGRGRRHLQPYRRDRRAPMAASRRNGRVLARPVTGERVVGIRSRQVSHVDITGIPAAGQADGAEGF